MSLPPNDATSSRGAAARGTFFGEPRAIGFLAFTEAWERFSYYGMTSILVLYMSQALFLPGRRQGIAGFAALRTGLESVFGPLSTLALASQVYGLYTGFIYFTPVLGGFLADRFIGRRRAVMLGAVLMSIGHIAMAFDVSFLPALALLIVGCGLLKGNISTQVGAFYPAGDAAGRTRGFAIFSMGINAGAIAGPLLIGYLAVRVGWHVAFGTAGILMLIGLATYIAGYKLLPEDRLSRNLGTPHAPLTSEDWQAIGALLIVMAITVFQSIAYYQNSNIGLIWIDHFVDLSIGGFHVPVAWFNSLDAASSVVFVPPLFALWRWQASRGRDRGELALIGAGAWVTAAANGLLAWAARGGGRVSAIYPIVYDVLLGIGFLYYWPVLLALVSRVAPARVQATLMGTAFLSLFIANVLIGWLGGFYERMPASEFWSMQSGIAAAGGLLALLLRPRLLRALTR